jgi:hypothetical protein
MRKPWTDETGNVAFSSSTCEELPETVFIPEGLIPSAEEQANGELRLVTVTSCCSDTSVVGQEMTVVSHSDPTNWVYSTSWKGFSWETSAGWRSFVRKRSIYAVVRPVHGCAGEQELTISGEMEEASLESKPSTGGQEQLEKTEELPSVAPGLADETVFAQQPVEQQQPADDAVVFSQRPAEQQQSNPVESPSSERTVSLADCVGATSTLQAVCP